MEKMTRSSRSTVVGTRCALGLATLMAFTGCAEPEKDGDLDWRAGPGAGAYEELRDFGANPGALRAFRYVPSPPPEGPAGLVVAMHACTQTAMAYRNAGWEDLADEYGFYVLYPEQTSSNNGAQCFNWAGEYGDPTNLMRGQGENRSIVSMVEKMQADYDIDANRVFVTGHSGGGAQTALMMATWPDVFAGGGIFAGIPYRCTTEFAQVSSCLSPGIDKTPEQHAQLVLDAYPGFSGRYPKLSIWHGTGDFTVRPINQTELLEQWTTVHGIDLQDDVVEMVDGATRRVYQNANGQAVIETWTLPNGGHATFNDPASDCGAAGQWFEGGICGVRYIAEFWGLLDPPGSGSGGGSGGESAGGSEGTSGGGGGQTSGATSAGDEAGVAEDGGLDGGEEDPNAASSAAADCTGAVCPGSAGSDTPMPSGCQCSAEGSPRLPAYGLLIVGFFGWRVRSRGASGRNSA